MSSNISGTTGDPCDEESRRQATLARAQAEYLASVRAYEQAEEAAKARNNPVIVDWAEKVKAEEAERAKFEAEAIPKAEATKPPHDHVWLIPVGPGHDPTETLKSLEPNERVVLVNDSGSDMSMHATDSVLVTATGGTATGCAHALNVGLESCVGEWERTWVYRMDSDDKAWPGHDRDKRADESQPEDIAWCGEMVRCDGMKMPMRATDWMDIRSLLELRRNPIYHPATIIRRKVLLDVGGWPEEYGRAEDYALWIKLMRRGRGRLNPWPVTWTWYGSGFTNPIEAKIRKAWLGQAAGDNHL